MENQKSIFEMARGAIMERADEAILEIKDFLKSSLPEDVIILA